jgi:hypothetical protein
VLDDGKRREDAEPVACIDDEQRTCDEENTCRDDQRMPGWRAMVEQSRREVHGGCECRTRHGRAARDDSCVGAEHGHRACRPPARGKAGRSQEKEKRRGKQGDVASGDRHDMERARTLQA